MKKTLGLLFIFLIAVTVLVACGGDDVEICFHEWEQTASEENMVSHATCQLPASYYSTCTLCGAKGSMFTSGETSEHSFAHIESEDMLVSAASCTERAKYHESCVYCGLAGEEIFSAGSLLQHDYVQKASAETLAIPRDCSTPNTYYLSCSVCAAKSSNVFTLGPTRPHTDTQGDLMCDFCMKPLEVFDDIPVDNLTDVHHFEKKEDQ